MIKSAFKKTEQGFTLVEVLVALVVTSLLVAILMDGAVSAKSRQKNQELQSEALLVAKSNINALRDIAGQPSSVKGTQAGLSWKLQEMEIARDPRGASILVEATISAGNNKKPQLVLLRKRYLKNLAVR